MTTGMQTEPTVETRRKRNWNWLWLLVAAIIVLAAIGYATTPKPPKTGSNATSQSVQDSGTGQQGSVGGFPENVVPNGGPGTVNNNPPNTPESTPAQGPGVPAAQSNNTGTDAGAGNSGISSTQEGLGGANPAGTKGSPSQTTTNGTDTGNMGHR